MTTSSSQTSKTIEELKEQAAHGKPLCIIPARKGSERLRNKNKLPINGKPLFMYAVDAAKESGLFDMIIVSSDDLEILELAYEAKATIHKRPKGLAISQCQIRDVVKFLLECYRFPEIFCLLIPCNPFRTAEDLKEAYKLMWDKEANYVMSVVEAHPRPETAIKIKNGLIVPRDDIQRSQKYTPSYYHDGSFIFARTQAFASEFHYDFYGTKCVPYIMPRRTVNIDTQEDYESAKLLMEIKK